MFKRGDRVQAKNPNLVFWMCATKVDEALEIAYCDFGHSGNYAGAFFFHELQMIED